MNAEPHLYKIDLATNKADSVSEVDFADLDIKEREHIQEWIADNPVMLGPDLLIIAKEYNQFDKTGERPDLVAVDGEGRLVIVELKRDDSGKNAHWQALKYASYFRNATAAQIAKILADYKLELSEDGAFSMLQAHLGADDDAGLAELLNRDQRIILASHRFAPEVTSTVLWLNEKVPDLITCIQLTPYKDKDTGELYVHANTIIPVPGTEPYVVGVGGNVPNQSALKPFSAGQATKNSHRNDEISQFLKETRDIVLNQLPSHLRPNKRSKWAGDGGEWGKFNRRQFHFWYDDPYWGNWKMSYAINVYDELEHGQRKTDVGLLYWSSPFRDLDTTLSELKVFPDQAFRDILGNGRNDEMFVFRYADELDGSFANVLAETMSRFIEVVTPQIDKLKEADNVSG